MKKIIVGLILIVTLVVAIVFSENRVQASESIIVDVIEIPVTEVQKKIQEGTQMETIKEEIVNEILEGNEEFVDTEENESVDNIRNINFILSSKEYQVVSGTTWEEWRKEIYEEYCLVTGIDWTVWMLTEEYMYVVVYRDRPVHMDDEIIDGAYYEFGLIDPDRYS